MSNSESDVYTLWGRNWPRLFILCSLLVVVLTALGTILNLVNVILRPNVLLLNTFCILFSFLAFSAEIRQFHFARKFTYHYMKNFYFLTYYRPRGLFYIFFGLLLFGHSILLLVAGGVAVGIGVLMLVISFIVDMPNFTDEAEIAREAMEQQRYQNSVDQSPATTTTVAQMFHLQKSSHKDNEQFTDSQLQFRQFNDAPKAHPPVARTQSTESNPATTLNFAGIGEGGSERSDVFGSATPPPTANVKTGINVSVSVPVVNFSSERQTPTEFPTQQTMPGMSHLRRDFTKAMEQE